MKISLETLDKLWPRASADLVEAVASQSESRFLAAGITTPLRAAHFMAQISHESSGGARLVESLNYSTTARLMQVWPMRFRNVAQAAPFVHQPQKLANEVYNGRLGNRPGTDDGWNYRGRGLIQITGRDNYAGYGAYTQLNLLNHPELAAEPSGALAVACAFWRERPCNAAADADDIARVTKLINGGLVGLEDRKAWLGRWKKELP